MNENLPINVDESQESGAISYANEVIATIVGVATAEVDGIAGMAGSSSFSNLLSGNRSKSLSRGVKVEVGAEEVTVDVSVVVDYGMPIQKVGHNVQENIRKSIETMTGLHVIKVDVHVVGVSFERENKELEQGQEFARIQADTNETNEVDASIESVIFTDEESVPASEPAADEEEASEEQGTKEEDAQQTPDTQA